jgi:hypothetical protein
MQGSRLTCPVYALEGVLEAFEGVSVAAPQSSIAILCFASVKLLRQEEDQMRRLTLSITCLVALFCLGLAAPLAMAGDDPPSDIPRGRSTR